MVGSHRNHWSDDIGMGGRILSECAHVASLCCISLIIKGLHLVWSDNLHSKQIKLFPFAMWQAFPAADDYGNSASMMDIRANSLGTPSCLPSFICWMSCAMVRLPVAVLVLAFRQSMSMSWPGCVLSMAPCEPPTGRSAFECHRHTSPAASSAFRPGSRVGEGDISALGCESTVRLRGGPPCPAPDDFRLSHHLKWSLSLCPRF